MSSPGRSWRWPLLSFGMCALAAGVWMIVDRRLIQATDVYAPDDAHLVVSAGQGFVILLPDASERRDCPCVIHQAIRGESSIEVGGEIYRRQSNDDQSSEVDPVHQYLNGKQDWSIVLSRYPDGQYLLSWQQIEGDSFISQTWATVHWLIRR